VLLCQPKWNEADHELVAPWMKMFLTFSWTIYQVVANIMVEECFWKCDRLRIQIFLKPFLDIYCDKFSTLLLGFDKVWWV
jgi:hypothetical protein